jgi:RecB family exonuclease
MTMMNRARPIKPDVTTPQGWLTHHRQHGRPFYEVKIGEWHRWRCSCGEKFFFTEADREAKPNNYLLD